MTGIRQFPTEAPWFIRRGIQLSTTPRQVLVADDFSIGGRKRCALQSLEQAASLGFICESSTSSVANWSASAVVPLPLQRLSREAALSTTRNACSASATR